MIRCGEEEDGLVCSASGSWSRRRGACEDRGAGRVVRRDGRWLVKELVGVWEESHGRLVGQIVIWALEIERELAPSSQKKREKNTMATVHAARCSQAGYMGSREKE